LSSPDERRPPAAVPRRWEWIALFAASAYLISPVIFLAWRHAGAGSVDLLFAFNLATSLLWITLLHVLVRRPLLLHLLLLPLYVTTAIDLFLIGTFGARLSTGYVNIALTDYGDTGELFRTYTRPIVLAALLLLLVYLPCLFGMRKLRKQRSARWAAAVAAMLLGVYALAVGRDLKEGQSARQAVLDVAGKELSSPVGALFQGGLALQMQAQSEAFRKQRASHWFGATKAAAAGSEIYVWVIGESSRPQNWSLFGYARDTTPRLRATPGVVGFPDMLTTAPHTSVAVPSMLSLRPITNWPGILAEHSIVEAFNEVGFKTYWLSAQAADSWAGLIPQIATEATRVRYFTSGYDGAMLDEFQQILADAKPGEKLFIVLHTKGSHFEYSRRYPAEFVRFSGGKTRRERLVDEYDNSVLYTDWFLAETIDSLEQRKGRSALIYASDHGENLLDDERQLLGHALGTAYDLPTAALIWVSDELARSRPQQMQALRAHSKAKLSLSNLPHSMLDLAGIQTRELDPRLSVFSDRFTPTPRSYIVRGELRSEKDATVAKAP
jgi:glucan phosphoethanolaminetransferase (alkaline phosphatase superfamily)